MSSKRVSMKWRPKLYSKASNTSCTFHTCYIHASVIVEYLQYWFLHIWMWPRSWMVCSLWNLQTLSYDCTHWHEVYYDANRHFKTSTKQRLHDPIWFISGSDMLEHSMVLEFFPSKLEPRSRHVFSLSNVGYDGTASKRFARLGLGTLIQSCTDIRSWPVGAV